MSKRGALSPLFSDVPLSADDAIVIAGALQDIAEVDGNHPEEQALIASLLEELSEELGDAFTLPRVTPQDIASKLSDPELRMVLLQSALLLAMADGKISNPERARIREYATALGINDVAYAEIEGVIETWVRSGDAQPLFS